MPSSPSQNPDEPPSLLKILASVFSGVLFGLFLSKLRTPIEHRGESIHPQEYTGEEHNSRPIQAPIIAEIAPAPIQTNQTEGPKNDIPRWKKIAEWSIAGATVGLLIINIFLWRATKESADAAKKSAEIADHSFQAERRRAEDMEEAVCILNSAVLRDNSFPVYINNTGKFTARDVKAQIEVSLNNPMSSKTIRMLIDDNISVPEIPGQKSWPQNTQNFPYKFKLPLSAHDWDDIVATKEIVVQHATLKYDNGFGRIISSSYCHAWIYFPTSDLAKVVSKDLLPSSPESFAERDCDGIPEALARIQERKKH